MRTWILVLASLVSPVAAHAEQVGVVVTGEPTLQPQLAAQLETWLRDRGRTVVPGPLPPEAINTLIDCFVLEDLGCARGVVDMRSKSKAVVYVRIDSSPGDDGMRDVEVTAHWFQKQRESLSERRVCSKCTDALLQQTVDELMLALVHEPPLPAKKPEPAAPVATPEEHEEPETAAVTTANPYRVPFMLLVVGGATMITGGVMIAIDEDPDPIGPQEPRYRDTATTGAVLAVVGGLTAGVGAFLWMRARAQQQASGPIVNVDGNGATLGWAGRF